MFAPPEIIIGPPDHSLAAGYPETVIDHDGGPLPVRYEIMQSLDAPRDILIRAIKINGVWHDPIDFGITDHTTAVWEDYCIELERDLALQP